MQNENTHGTIGWSEYNTNDPESARAFYSAVCGWHWQTVPMGPGQPAYHLASQSEGGAPVAGIFDMNGLSGAESIPPMWMTYLSVNDVDQACNDVAQAGGKIERAPWDVPGTGRIAVVIDNGGAMLGLLTPEAM